MDGKHPLSHQNRGLPSYLEPAEKHELRCKEELEPLFDQSSDSDYKEKPRLEDLTLEIERRKVPKASSCGLHWSLAMILHLISAGFVSFILFKAIPGFDFFSIHPICMTVGYGIMMLEAILIFSSWPIIGTSKRTFKITVHWILQLSSIILASIGFGVAYVVKTSNGKSHFTTWHSWLGLATLVASILNAGGGILAKYPTLVKKYQRPLMIKSVHALFACLTFTLACSSLYTGLLSNYFARLTKDSLPIWQICYAVPPIMGIFVVTQVLQSYLPRLRKGGQIK